MLEIKNLSKSFGAKKVLNDVSLQVGRGRIAMLLGSSGVGKSTLLRILNDLDNYDKGFISLDGKPLDIKQANKKHIVGMVFQQFNLFENLTVEENIILALELTQKKNKTEAKKIAHQLLERYGLEEKAHARIRDLSGGQKQRLALARTLALKPTVICLDEPTSALDPLLTSYVATNIGELAQDNYIVLVASHDISLLEKLDCDIYLMKNGQIVETATSADFRINQGHYPLISSFIAGK